MVQLQGSMVMHVMHLLSRLVINFPFA